MTTEDEVTPDPEPAPKPARPKAWKAGRKPKPNTKKKLGRYGTDEAIVGGKLAIRADTRLDVPERDDPAYKKFSDIVGGREGLQDLASWSENPKAQKLFELLDDERYKTYGIKALAKRCGMTLPELCNLFREKHFLQMYLTFFGGIPKIAEGVVQDAQPSLDVCPVCVGEKFITRNKLIVHCPKCSGTGQVRIPGDKEARRDVFKAVGIVKDSPSVINNQIGNVTVEGVDDFEALMKSAQTTPILKVKSNDQEEEIPEAETIE